MATPDLLTAEEFAESKFDLPEAGRWSELLRGRVVTFQPPDLEHGTTVLNLSKAIAEHVGGAEAVDEGYACFGVGLVVARNPDTVRCPAMSWFVDGPPFSEVEKPVTDMRPVLVVELASTNDRRHAITDRVREYHEWGVGVVWIVDPHAQEIHMARRDRPTRQYAEHQTFSGSPVLSGFRIRVADLFAEPHWWRH